MLIIIFVHEKHPHRSTLTQIWLTCLYNVIFTMILDFKADGYHQKVLHKREANPILLLISNLVEADLIEMEFE